MGVRYQWGRKDPFTFATSSESSGLGNNDKGKYPVKIYTIDGVLIYQENNGSSNKDKQPSGGVIYLSISSTSMMETIKNPIIFNGTDGAIINQVGHTKDLWNFYWVSYSRGTDGSTDNSGKAPNRHNNYLNGYVSQRYKSIYDPCPHGFRVSSNGTYNQLNTNQKWSHGNYVGGFLFSLDSFGMSWFSGLGGRTSNSGQLLDVGVWAWYISSTIGLPTKTYSFLYYSYGTIQVNRMDLAQSGTYSVRCIEEQMLVLFLRTW